MKSLLRLFFVLTLVVGATGCVRYKTNITGTVTRDGKPLEWQTEGGTLQVLFVPEDRSKSGPVRAVTDRATCTFRIAEIPAGKYTVAVQQFDDRFNDAFGGRFDAYRSRLYYEVTDDNQVINVDLPKD